MSRFFPTMVTIDPPPPHDAAAYAVLQGLSRPIGQKASWSVLKSAVVGLLTFGVAPLLAWMRGLRVYAVAEQQQYLHLARWVRGHSDHPLTRQLVAEAEDLRLRPWLSWLAAAALAFTVVGMLAMMAGGPRRGPVTLDDWVAGTYGYGRQWVLDYRVRPLAAAGDVFALWCWGLVGAYGCQWLQVQLRARDVRRFVDRLGQVLRAEGLPPARAERVGTGLRPFWLIGGACMCVLNAPWGLALMLAGGVQRRYITWASRYTRAEVGQRLRELMLRRVPGQGVPVPVYVRERCVERLCRAELPPGARFCRRCGTPQRGDPRPGAAHEGGAVSAGTAR